MSRQQYLLRKMTRRTLLMIIILLQDFVPFLGNIPLGPLSITTLPMTITIIAILFGPGEGGFLGGFWGILTWVRAFVYPSSPLAPLIFTNPLIAVVPRICVGIVAGYVFIAIKNHWLRFGMIIAGVTGSLTNTVMVLSGIMLFANNSTVANAYHVNQAGLAKALMVILATNGVLEMVMAALVVPLIAGPLLKTKYVRTTNHYKKG